jgi:uncharacterized BrkB/YihY/UPF0761 family membrane protein
MRGQSSATERPASPDPAAGSAKESLPERAKRLSAESMAWAVEASKRHLTVAMSFRAAQQNRRVAAAVLAGGFAYRIFFWLLALGLVGGGVLGFLQGDSLDAALDRAGIPGAVVASVGSFAHDSDSARWWLLLLGGYLMLWSGYSGSKAARLVHALIWDEPPTRLAKPLKASLLFSGVCLGVGLVMAGSWWLKQNATAGAVTAVIVLVLPLTALWVWVSLLLPHRDAGWKDLVPGAVLVAAGFQVLHVLTLWLALPKLESSQSTYGPLGVVATILFWGYLIGRLIVSAAILNASLYDERQTFTPEERPQEEPAGETPVGA